MFFAESLLKFQRLMLNTFDRPIKATSKKVFLLCNSKQRAITFASFLISTSLMLNVMFASYEDGIFLAGTGDKILFFLVLLVFILVLPASHKSHVEMSERFEGADTIWLYDVYRFIEKTWIDRYFIFVYTLLWPTTLFDFYAPRTINILVIVFALLVRHDLTFSVGMKKRKTVQEAFGDLKEKIAIPKPIPNLSGI